MAWKLSKFEETPLFILVNKMKKSSSILKNHPESTTNLEMRSRSVVVTLSVSRGSYIIINVIITKLDTHEHSTLGLCTPHSSPACQIEFMLSMFV